MVFAQSHPRSEIQLSSADLEDGELNTAARTRARSLYEEFGCLVLHDVFPRDFIGELKDAFLARYATDGPGALEASCLKVGDKRMMVTIEVKAPFDAPSLYANPILVPLFTELMEGDCVINGFGGVVAFPGAQAQPPHRDHPFLFGGREGDWKLGGSLPPYAITMVVPLVDLTIAVGATALWEESHRTGLSVGSVLTTHRAGLPLVPAGDVYLMDYRLVHGGMPNLSRTPRPIMYVTYSRAWFRDTVNYSKQEPIIISASEYERIPREHKRLFDLARPRES
jgi:phytanoyl-CoA dioxygenase PhyH